MNPTTEIQLKRLTIFSSGVGFYQYNGNIEGSKEMSLPFNKNAVNDALKSLIVSDPDVSPSVSYHAENTLQRTMKGLSIDLQGKNHIAELLKSLKGAEIEVYLPNPLIGRIMLVEYRLSHHYQPQAPEIDEREAFLTLFTEEGIRIIALKEVTRFTFTDPKINEDVNRALDLILQSRDSDTRSLTVKLPGQKQRNVSLSYVIPTPIWKVSYRLDLSKETPLLQGWAIVDNDSDTDWEQIELALVTGKPVSFIQNLYAPYNTSRPTLPLAIAGIAEAKTYESGTPKPKMMARKMSTPVRGISGGGDVLCQSELDSMLMSMQCEEIEPELSVEDLLVSTQLEEGVVETADGRAAGDQFEFTVKTPVSLARQQSTMLPLVNGTVSANKLLVFSGNKAVRGKRMNPAIAAELINDTGMKLPAGPITVYDGGTYAGDALIAFFPEGEKRIISYGEDLSVSGCVTVTTKETFISVSIKNGIASQAHTETYEHVYTFRNASNETKSLIIEHPLRHSPAKLIEPAEYAEKTNNLYRFELSLPPGETIFIVREEEPYYDEITLSDCTMPDFVGTISNPELPEPIRASLKHAMALYEKIGNESATLIVLQKQLAHLLDEQERTRKNLAAAGSQTQQGQNYLIRLTKQDSEIDETNAAIAVAEQAVHGAENEYYDYLKKMYFK